MKKAINFVKRKKYSQLSGRTVDIGGVSLRVFADEEVKGKEEGLVPVGYISKFGNDFNSEEVVGHLRWMAQKITLKQDMFLMGGPSSLRRHLVLSLAELCGYEVEYIQITRDTSESDLKQRKDIVGDSVFFTDQAPVRAATKGRLLILDGVENAERNVLPTLNNLLENREMALEDGRFLMREEHINVLEDGASASLGDEGGNRLVAVHPDFRVVALAMPVPTYSGRPLDPPLRSRFQCRFVEELSISGALDCVGAQMSQLPTAKLSALGRTYEGLRQLRREAAGAAGGAASVPMFSLNGLQHAIGLLASYPELSALDAVSRALPLGYRWRLDRHHGNGDASNKPKGIKNGTGVILGSMPPRLQSILDGIVEELRESSSSSSSSSSSAGKVDLGSLDTEVVALLDGMTHAQRTVTIEARQDLQSGRAVCIHGPKGCGKSLIMDAIASPSAWRLFPLYEDLTARDLLQRRETKIGETKKVATVWADSPLIEAARTGQVVVLDGIDRANPQALLPLRRLLQDGEIELPSGEKLVSWNIDEHRKPHTGTDTEGAGVNVTRIHPDFRVVATGLPPTRPDDERVRYLCSDLGFSHHTLPALTPAEIASVLGATRHGDEKRGEVSRKLDALVWAVSALHAQAGVHEEIKPTCRHAMRVAAILRASEGQDVASGLGGEYHSEEAMGGGGGAADGGASRLRALLERVLMVRYLSQGARETFHHVMRDVESDARRAQVHDGGMEAGAGAAPPVVHGKALEVAVGNNGADLRIGRVTLPRRTPTEPQLIPRPLYFPNDTQTTVLEGLARSISAKQTAILLIGNQGVGKNKLADRLCELLNAEREYAQLHRDTSVASLTVAPSLEDGAIVLKESPLVRAARTGRIMVLDEVDKAPLEVVCVLKGLLGDGEVVLPDGRRLVMSERGDMLYSRYLNSHSHSDSGDALGKEAYFDAQHILCAHPDFLLLALANRPGHPFLGNNFFNVCGEVMDVHVIENPDRASELALLQAHAPGVPEPQLGRLADAFQELRALNEAGTLNYPFSAREAVSVARHAEAYPEEGVIGGVEDMLGFEGMNPDTRALVAGVFRHHGFQVENHWQPSATGGGTGSIVGGRRGGSRDKGPGSSTPRTPAGAPKEGKHDDKPHVGGNTWAGGSGGSDTAGLGGRGGPWRLDKGHPVHQISDEDKADVSEESMRAAREMNRKAFAKRLEEIGMGKRDYDTYRRYSDGVGPQVSQLKEILAELARRSSERVWLRNQAHGELDDGRLVDGLSGEKLVFKRRGAHPDAREDEASGDGGPRKRRVQFVFDCSGSMMRFNGMDRRLERSLEAALMVMEALPRRRGDATDGSDGMVEDDGGDDGGISDLVHYSLSGHSGDTDQEIFIDFPGGMVDPSGGQEGANDDDGRLSNGDAHGQEHWSWSRRHGHASAPHTAALNEKERMGVLETMVAHSQFCFPGDHTLDAVDRARERVLEGAIPGDHTARLVVVVSDANFRRYGINPWDVTRAMQADPRVQVHMILIASLGDEAEQVAKSLPLGQAHLCTESSDLPAILKRILTSFGLD